jgi:dihydrofolate synthase/folylpolyglutamate synthase
MQASYSRTIKELFDLQIFSIKMGLENITLLCKDLENPQDSYPVIHLAGTNGKGSTSSIINAILIGHGLKVGLYTSPHLIDFRERIKVGNRFIEEDFVTDYWDRMRPRVHDLKATFFDTTTALAFEFFAKSKVDVSVIETGLGGRLDSTNIVKPVAAVITPISIDHIQQLGKNLKSIANEKAVIVKTGSTFFSAKQKKEVREIFKTASKRAEVYHALPAAAGPANKKIHPGYSQFDLTDRIRKIKIENLKLNLAGKFQIDNACLAYLASRWYLERNDITFSEDLFRKSLSEIEWPGRLQMVSKEPMIFLDVSHNYSGFSESTKFVCEISEISNRSLIMGLLDDKEYKQIVRLLSKYFRKIVVTEPLHERAIPASVLSREFLRYGIHVSCEPSIIQAYRKAKKNLKNNDQLYIMGSHFIIGELLKVINKKNLTQ